RMYSYNSVMHWSRMVVIDEAELANYPQFSLEAGYPRVAPVVAFPSLGVVMPTLDVVDSVFVVRLASTYPYHQRFERRLPGGNWVATTEYDVLPVGACRVEYRSVDDAGSISATSILDVWAPRTEDFVQSAPPWSVRAQASYCVSP